MPSIENRELLIAELNLEATQRARESEQMLNDYMAMYSHRRV